MARPDRVGRAPPRPVWHRPPARDPRRRDSPAADRGAARHDGSWRSRRAGPCSPPTRRVPLQPDRQSCTAGSPRRCSTPRWDARCRARCRPARYTTLELKTNFVRPLTRETGRVVARRRRPRGLAGRDRRGPDLRRGDGQAGRPRHDDLHGAERERERRARGRARKSVSRPLDNACAITHNRPMRAGGPVERPPPAGFFSRSARSWGEAGRATIRASDR